MLLFLGAGSSKAFGIPDTKGFITEFESVIGESEIYKRLKSVIPEELLDMETLMTILDDLSRPKEELLDSIAPHTTRFLLNQKSDIPYLTENESLKSNCCDMLREVKRVIRIKCLDQVASNRMSILNSYDEFFRVFKFRGPKLVNARDNSGMQYPELKIFTTNYDTCIETYFNSRQVDLDKGIAERYGEQVFDVATFSKARPVELVKLHGSIDLFARNRKVRFLAAAGAMDTKARTYIGEEYGQEFMIYPVESSASAEVFQSPYIELLHIFRDRLVKSDAWVIIGSTFRDSTLVSIMNDVITHKTKKNIQRCYTSTRKLQALMAICRAKVMNHWPT